MIEKKFTFIQDLLLAISEGVNMMRLAVLKSYEDISKIRPFEGLTGLRQRRLFFVCIPMAEKEKRRYWRL